MVMADFSQTRIFGKVGGQFLHARWRLWSPIIDAQIGGWAVSFRRSVLESDRQFRSLSYTSYSGICLVVSRVCYTPDAIVSLFVRRVGTFSHTPRTGISPVVRRARSFCYTPSGGMCQVVRRVRIIFYMTRGGMCLVVRWAGSLLHALC